MSINKEFELIGMKKISEVVAITLKEMRAFAKPGMSTKELDNFGGQKLKEFGATSAPKKTYQFPGHTCISVNEQAAHGVPNSWTILKEGDLVNIDVSAELDGFWSDNGGSFVLGNDLYNHQPLVEASKDILKLAIDSIRQGVRVSEVGFLIEREAKKRGFGVIKNLAGHGVGRSLHEAPSDILNYGVRSNKVRFTKNSTVAIETFISTLSNAAVIGSNDGWTLVGDKGGFVAQHEHSILVTDDKPLILTSANDIWA